MSHYTFVISGLICALLVAGCATAQPSVVPMSLTATPVPPTATAYPPTERPAPTATPIPRTRTPTPTGTPVPPTVTPTFTPLPPLSASGGGVIAFSSDRSGRSGIYVMNADGSDQRLVTDEENAAYPAFSPDGARIAFASERDGNWEIYTMNADGSQPRRLTNNEAQDTFLPGDLIDYMRINRHLVRVNEDLATPSLREPVNRLRGSINGGAE